LRLEPKTPATLVGLGCGDALGMPFETLDGTVHPELETWAQGAHGEYRAGTFHKLGPGTYTDDTEMAECLARSLIEQRGSFDGDAVARRYLAWFQGSPTGMGGTTRTAMQRLAEGVPYFKSGVVFAPNDAAVGSAPAMRSAPLGAALSSPSHGEHRAHMLFLICCVDASITHIHPEAELSSFAVAIAVMLSRHGVSGLELIGLVENEVERMRRTAAMVREYPRSPTVLQDNLRAVCNAVRDGVSPFMLLRDSDALPEKDRTITRRGNARSIVATALHCAAFYPDFETAVTQAVKLWGHRRIARRSRRDPRGLQAWTQGFRDASRARSRARQHRYVIITESPVSVVWSLRSTCRASSITRDICSLGSGMALLSRSSTDRASSITRWIAGGTCPLRWSRSSTDRAS